jgi:phospholipid/cholesterol/gamma-HCH transport system permease protein
MPKMVVGYSTREILILEFSSSIMCLILAGKVGSNITSEIGTMRVTQQIDALEIMGVNSANFLILPKITALISMIPMLVIFSIAAGTAGAFAIGKFTGIMTPEDLMVGLQYEFQQWYIWCSIIKSVAFAFIITSVSSFYGYRVSGGSLEVGKASTNAVVSCSALILFADMILTQLLMQ